MTLLKRRGQQNDFLGCVGRMEGQIREDTWQGDGPESFTLKPVRCPNYRVMVKSANSLGKSPRHK